MVAVDFLATARLTRLVVADTFPPVRRTVDAIKRHERVPGWVVDLLECGWCFSTWVGAGVVAARLVAPRWWDPVARILAASMVAGLVIEAGYLIEEATEGRR